MERAEVQRLEREWPLDAFLLRLPDCRRTSPPSLLLSPAGPTGVKGLPAPDPPRAASPRPSQPRMPHRTCHSPPLLSQTPGPPFSSFSCSPQARGLQGRRLPPRLAPPAAGLASSGFGQGPHAHRRSWGPRAAAASSAPHRLPDSLRSLREAPRLLPPPPPGI